MDSIQTEFKSNLHLNNKLEYINYLNILTKIIKLIFCQWQLQIYNTCKYTQNS